MQAFLVIFSPRHGGGNWVVGCGVHRCISSVCRALLGVYECIVLPWKPSPPSFFAQKKQVSYTGTYKDYKLKGILLQAHRRSPIFSCRIWLIMESSGTGQLDSQGPVLVRKSRPGFGGGF